MNLNGVLMSGDIETARIEEGKVVPINEHLMPIYLQRADDFKGWLAERAIDKHRTNSRLLKKALRLTTAEDTELVLKVHAATITDNYWFKEAGSSLTYDDVKFKTNIFDKLALYGDPDSFNNPETATPELTNIGSFEKCWRLTDGKWWLYKQGNEKERFSELFISYFGRELGFNMAYYELEDSYIKSFDYTNQAEVNYEAMSGFVGEDEDYQRSFDVLYGICIEAAKDYVKMIFLDTICFNMDRHTKNYGVLRDSKTGQIMKLAPNFDNNIALISRGYPKNIERKNDRMIQLFCEFISKNDTARAFYEEINTEAITDELIKDCIRRTGFEVDEELVSNFIISGTRIILNQVMMLSEISERQDMSFS